MQRFSQLLLLVALGLPLVSLTGCANSPLAENMQRSLEADPQLTEETPSRQSDSAAEDPPSDTATPAPGQTATPASAPAPEPGHPDFIGPLGRGSSATVDNAASGAQLQLPPAIDQAPEELQPYVRDLLQLGVLPSQPGASSTGASQAQAFQPNQTINRRTFARWLVTTNNAFYKNQADKRIRLAVADSQPVFQDVASSDPDFVVIQGLAEAGLVPSPLTGSSTTVTFRPDAPLTREDLILWKVPLDTRQTLPAASIEAVKQTWGFQDTEKIEPRALQAVLADYQNGEFANIRRALGYTTLFQPDKGVTQAEAAAVLWRFGNATEGISAADVLAGQDGAQARPSPSSRSGTADNSPP